MGESSDASSIKVVNPLMRDDNDNDIDMLSPLSVRGSPRDSIHNSKEMKLAGLMASHIDKVDVDRVEAKRRTIPVRVRQALHSVTAFAYEEMIQGERRQSLLIPVVFQLCLTAALCITRLVGPVWFFFGAGSACLVGKILQLACTGKLKQFRREREGTHLFLLVWSFSWFYPAILTLLPTTLMIYNSARAELANQSTIVLNQTQELYGLDLAYRRARIREAQDAANAGHFTAVLGVAIFFLALGVFGVGYTLFYPAGHGRVPRKKRMTSVPASAGGVYQLQQFGVFFQVVGFTSVAFSPAFQWQEGMDTPGNWRLDVAMRFGVLDWGMLIDEHYQHIAFYGTIAMVIFSFSLLYHAYQRPTNPKHLQWLNKEIIVQVFFDVLTMPIFEQLTKVFSCVEAERWAHGARVCGPKIKGFTQCMHSFPDVECWHINHVAVYVLPVMVLLTPYYVVAVYLRDVLQQETDNTVVYFDRRVTIATFHTKLVLSVIASTVGECNPIFYVCTIQVCVWFLIVYTRYRDYTNILAMNVIHKVGLVLAAVNGAVGIAVWSSNGNANVCDLRKDDFYDRNSSRIDQEEDDHVVNYGWFFILVFANVSGLVGGILYYHTHKVKWLRHRSKRDRDQQFDKLGAFDKERFLLGELAQDETEVDFYLIKQRVASYESLKKLNAEHAADTQHKRFVFNLYANEGKHGQQLEAATLKFALAQKNMEICLWGADPESKGGRLVMDTLRTMHDTKEYGCGFPLYLGAKWPFVFLSEDLPAATLQSIHVTDLSKKVLGKYHDNVFMSSHLGIKGVNAIGCTALSPIELTDWLRPEVDGVSVDSLLGLYPKQTEIFLADKNMRPTDAALVGAELRYGKYGRDVKSLDLSRNHQLFTCNAIYNNKDSNVWDADTYCYDTDGRLEVTNDEQVDKKGAERDRCYFTNLPRIYPEWRCPICNTPPDAFRLVKYDAPKALQKPTKLPKVPRHAYLNLDLTWDNVEGLWCKHQCEGIRTDGWKQLCEGLKESRIEILRLSDIGLVPAPARMLAEALPDSIVTLKLTHNEGMVGTLAEPHKTVSNINVPLRGVDHEGGLECMKLLLSQKLANLRVLRLRQIGMGPQAAQLLADSPLIGQIEHLDLSYNYICGLHTSKATETKRARAYHLVDDDTKGWSNFCDALQKSSSLTRLDVSGIGMGTKGLKVLAAFIKHSKSLRALHVSHNFLFGIVQRKKGVCKAPKHAAPEDQDLDSWRKFCDACKHCGVDQLWATGTGMTKMALEDLADKCSSQFTLLSVANNPVCPVNDALKQRFGNGNSGSDIVIDVTTNTSSQIDHNTSQHRFRHFKKVQEQMFESQRVLDDDDFSSIHSRRRWNQVGHRMNEAVTLGQNKAKTQLQSDGVASDDDDSDDDGPPVLGTYRDLKWSAGDEVNADTEDGVEKGVTILGKSKNRKELRVRFRDGTVDDWPMDLLSKPKKHHRYQVPIYLQSDL
jgi:hypothetical protein